MKVVIVGGTHGNEKTGVFLAQKFLEFPHLLPKGLEYKILIGNPGATSKNIRFQDFDLNRSFGPERMKNQDIEGRRAREIRNEILNWVGEDPFFLIDLHTTTANMGSTVILPSKDLLSAFVANNFKETCSEGRLIFNNHEKSRGFLASIAPHSLLIEFGPVPQNVFCPTGIEKTEKVLMVLLKAILRIRNSGMRLVDLSLTGIEEGRAVEFPQDSEGRVAAYLHPNFSGKDFQRLKNGDPIFVHRNGSLGYFKGDDDVYPLFIGESAYLNQKIAYVEGKLVTQYYQK